MAIYHQSIFFLKKKQEILGLGQEVQSLVLKNMIPEVVI